MWMSGCCVQLDPVLSFPSFSNIPFINLPIIQPYIVYCGDWMTDWLTDFMELGPARKVASCAATQFPNVLWNRKVHYRVHKNPPLVPILSQVNPGHTILAYFSETHFNIIHPHTCWCS
jgi:hypothetical protein